LNGNQVQQVSEETLNFERAPLKLQRAIKSPPTKTREREREGRKRGRGWRGWGDDAACEKNRDSLSFLGRSFDGPEKIFWHWTAQNLFFGQLSLIWALHKVEWTWQFGNIDLAMWNWWLGNADMATGLGN